MKSWIVTTFTFFSVNAMANTENIQKPLDTNTKEPTALIQIFDTSKTQPTLMDGNSISRSKPRQLCVIVFNVPILEQNLFAEYLQAPKPMQIKFEGANVQVEDNKKNFLITFNVAKEQILNNLISQCWTFSKNDPIGTYKLDVQFNDIVFKNLEFKVLK